MSTTEGNSEVGALLARLDDLDLDAQGAAFDFSARLAQENGWTPGYTARVVREYKRFVALAVCAGHPVTPSVAVDQAWHLHLVYTRSYWQDLCGTVLGRPLHHEPTAGGAEEASKFHAQYDRTLLSYRELFGEVPPADIWPGAKQRFGAAPLRWLDPARAWTIAKPTWVRHRRWPRRPALLPQGIALVTGLTLVGCELNVFDYGGSDFLAFYVVGFLVSFIASLVIVHFGRRQSTTSPGEPLSDPYDIAMLGAGDLRMQETALAALYARGCLDVDVPLRRARAVAIEEAGEMSDLHPVEQALLRALPKTGHVGVAQLHPALRGSADAAKNSLTARGLILTPHRRARLRWYAATPLLVMIAVGCMKVVVGLTRHRPVAYLVMLLVISVVVLLARVGFVSLRTIAGDDAWKRLQDGRTPLRGARPSPSHVTTAVALGGVVALTDVPAFSEFRRVFTPMPSTSNSCSSSDSGGGGGGGGGCGGGGGGGCGGCGGGGGD